MNNYEINRVIESIAKEECALAEILHSVSRRPSKEINEILLNVITLEEVLVNKLKVAVSTRHHKHINNEYVTVCNDEVKQDLYQTYKSFF